mgnify:FL=1
MSDFLQNLNPNKNNKQQDQFGYDDSLVLESTDSKLSIQELSDRDLPESLFRNHYEMHELYPHITAEAWRRFLKENDRFIMQEVAAVTEASARAALQRLGSGLLKQGDATAITQLLNRSEQINQSVKDKTTYVTMFLPNPSTALVPERGIAEQVKDNKDVANVFYPRQVFQLRESRGEMVWNEDGTIHFPMPEAITHLDKVYMHFHNPSNALVSEIVDGDLEWQ